MARKIFVQNPEKFIPALASALKEMPEFEVPEWAMYVKSGPSRERPPMDVDFWYVRAASVLRQLYIRGVVGVGKLRTRYGSRKDRGGKPDKFCKASGKIIRVILQQAEAAGLVEKVTRMQFGRRLTEKGREFLDSIEAPYEDLDMNAWIGEDKKPEILQEENDEEVEVVSENTEEENREGDVEEGEYDENEIEDSEGEDVAEDKVEERVE
jgi:small subunit ribosomal protein S19e